MKLLTTLFFGFCFLITISNAEKARYDFYRLYEVSIDEEIQLELMHQISEYPDGYRFLSSAPGLVGIKTELIVPPHKFGDWSELVEKFNLKVLLLNNNLQNSIDKEEARNKRKKSLDWDNFWTLDEIYSWMDTLVEANPNDLSIFILGTSYEGRQIKGLKINKGNTTGKPSIFFESNIHGGEWLGPSSTTYIITELLNTNYSLLDDFNWYFVPVLNVDGYSYAWTRDRLWRKTRRPSSKNLLCIGADPNRNSDINWGVSSVSNNPCSNNYPGDFAFSEPEIRDLATFVSNIPDLKIYFSFHTFGQFFMIPTGYTNERIENYQLHYDIGLVANQAIFNTTGAIYDLGPIPQFFGLVSGISFDWVIANVKPVITYCWELRPNRANAAETADAISSKHIRPTAEEMYAAVTTVINEARRRSAV